MAAEPLTRLAGGGYPGCFLVGVAIPVTVFIEKPQ